MILFEITSFKLRFLSYSSIIYKYYNLYIGGDFIHKFLHLSYLSIVIILIFVSVFFIPVIDSNSFSNSGLDSEIIDFNPAGFVWPIPGYTKISSPFGKRTAPTAGAASSHTGIDIPAPEGTKFIAIADGEITFCQFLGGGGFTITLSFDNYKISYCHCSPNFIVKVGDKVKQGQVIRSSWTSLCLWCTTVISTMMKTDSLQMVPLLVVICILESVLTINIKIL